MPFQKQSKTLLLTLWKSENQEVSKTESGELGSAVSNYVERIRADRSIEPCFNTFYEYMRDVYRKELEEREIKVEKADFNIDNFLTTLRQYYKLAKSANSGSRKQTTTSSSLSRTRSTSTVSQTQVQAQ